MNGKAAKALRFLKKDTHKDKKRFKSLSQKERYIMRMAAKTIKVMGKKMEQ